MNFHYTIQVEMDMTNAVLSLEESLKKEGFGVLWEFSLTEKLQSKGLDFDIPFVILEVCNPEEAARVIKEELLAGYFLPCKIVVYKQEDAVQIGMIKPSVLIDVLGNNELKRLAEDIEQRLIGCLEDLR